MQKPFIIYSVAMNASPPAGSKRSTFIEWADNRTPTNPFVFGLRRLVRLILITLKEFGTNAISIRASALTYIVLLSMVPMLAMSTALIKGMGGGDQLREMAFSYLDTLEEHSAPATKSDTAGLQVDDTATAPMDNESPSTIAADSSSSNLTSHLRSALNTLFDYVDNTNFAAIGSFGVIGILFSILMVFNHVEKALNKIWKVTKGRSMIRKLSDYIMLMVLIPITINIAFASSAFLKHPALFSKFEQYVPVEWLQALFLQTVPILVIALTFFVIYTFFTNTKVKYIPAITGALLAATLWFSVQNIYITLQVGVANYNAIYGSFASFPLFLVWIYMGWIFILMGSQIAYVIQNIDHHRLIPQSSVPSIRLSGAFDILDRVERGYLENEKVTVESLIENLKDYEGELVEDVTDKLLTGNLIYTAKSKKILLPSSPTEMIDRKEVIDLIFGTVTAETSGGENSRQIIKAAEERAEHLGDVEGNTGKPDQDSGPVKQPVV